jgi:hypothetical protein
MESAKLASDMDLVPIDQYPPLTVANSINRHQLRVVAIDPISSSAFPLQTLKNVTILNP